MGMPDENGATGTFWDHLDVLRGCLLRAIGVTALCGIVAFFFKDELFRVVLAPKDSGFCTYRFLEYPCKMLGILKIKNDGLNVRTR